MWIKKTFFLNPSPSLCLYVAQEQTEGTEASEQERARHAELLEEKEALEASNNELRDEVEQLTDDLGASEKLVGSITPLVH